MKKEAQEREEEEEEEVKVFGQGGWDESGLKLFPWRKSHMFFIPLGGNCIFCVLHTHILLLPSFTAVSWDVQPETKDLIKPKTSSPFPASLICHHFSKIIQKHPNAFLNSHFLKMSSLNMSPLYKTCDFTFCPDKHFRAHVHKASISPLRQL